MAHIGIIGGGVAGSTVALYLGRIGLEVTLFEQRPGLVSGPPFCHLHAGGNLYREIPDEECITLLHQSIDLLKFYPYAVDFRPTVIAIPLSDSGEPNDLLPRLKKLQNTYRDAIAKDHSNQVLGESRDYFRLYERQTMERLRERKTESVPKTPDEWMIPVAQNLDFEKVKFPLLMVQEYGLNLFALAAGVSLSFEGITNCNIRIESEVTDIQKEEKGWEVTYSNGGSTVHEHFDYLVNAAGFRSGKIDDMLHFKRERLVEFKAAYVTKWEACHDMWPEVIFHGQRGTPNGMGQFTPYPGGYFQLHGMTKDITLFDEGLVESSEKSAQPKLKQKFIDKIDKQWQKNDVIERSQSAIKHLCRFIPGFCEGKIASKPLFGAQQIPGKNKELRAADVSFEGDRYARCEVVKASSVLTMTDQIVAKLIGLGYLKQEVLGRRKFEENSISKDEIEAYAKQLAKARDYPKSLGERSVPEPQE